MKHCLVVDDSSVIRKVARRILEGFELQISEAEDGQKALDACSKAMPDAILVDSSMPLVDGFEFMRQLRRMPGGKTPKIVLCMSENDIAQMTKAVRAGANGTLFKPFEIGHVEATFRGAGLI